MTFTPTGTFHDFLGFSPNTLDFGDEPTDGCIASGDATDVSSKTECGHLAPVGSKMQFITLLVGVTAIGDDSHSGNYVPLASFQWESDFNGTIGGVEFANVGRRRSRQRNRRRHAVKHPGISAGSNRRRGSAQPDLGERWPSRLLATAEEDRLNPRRNSIDDFWF
jgi:hypothetical protein